MNILRYDGGLYGIKGNSWKGMAVAFRGIIKALELEGFDIESAKKAVNTTSRYIVATRGDLLVEVRIANHSKSSSLRDDLKSLVERRGNNVEIDIVDFDGYYAAKALLKGIEVNLAPVEKPIEPNWDAIGWM